MRTRVRIAFSALVALLVLTMPAIASSAPHVAASVDSKLVATQMCACGSSVATIASGLPEMRGHGPPNEANYDEQLGITFGQSFTSLEYNVTAMEQTDPTLGTGPAYLLNGLSNTGFWYQVGVSWNWGPGQTPGTGFSMNYEVFSPSGASIFPTNGGGLEQFSGVVNAGDTVTLNLYFDNSQVVMIAEDMNTGAFAQQTFPAEGGSYFIGLPNSIADSNGFFTGLMTEWYHGAPYYENLQSTVFSTTHSISSSWMWMDEFNGNNDQVVFTANTTSPTSFTANPSQLQEFAYNGTTEYASGLEFVTGALPSGTTTTTTTTSTAAQVVLTLGYRVQGGGSGYGAPTLTYVSNGTSETATITTTPTGYKVDQGSQWSISSSLPGGTSTERWIAENATSGSAAAPSTYVFVYQNQYYVVLASNDPGGGTVQPASGWQDSGAPLQVASNASSGWKFEGWSGTGQGASNSTDSTLNLQVESPISETAVFYPGLVVTTPAAISVSYAVEGNESMSGTVQPGTTETIYAPPSSLVSLTARPTSFVYSFLDWKNIGSNSPTLVVLFSGPGSISPESAYNYGNIIAVVCGIAAIVLAAVLGIMVRSRRRAVPITQPAPSDVPAGGLT